MKKTNDRNRGITLIALVITIIVMLILVAVTISMAINGGLFNYAGKATGDTKNAIAKEQNLGIGDIIEEYLVGKKVEVEIGDFIEYDVAYIDAYVSSNVYSTKNGWRILSVSKNEDGTYTDVKLISTGIPAKLYYDFNDTTNNQWYVTDTNKLSEFKELLGGSNYTFWTGTGTFYALQASAGMYYNFENIKFAYGAENRGKGLGYFTSITSKGITYDNANEVEKTGGEIFNVYGKEKAEVRLVTLPEINKALERTDIDSTAKITTDTKGIYILDQLNTVAGMVDYSYLNSRADCWLASPKPSTGVYNYGHVCSLGVNGGFGSDNGYSGAKGVRPLVCLKSKVQFIDTNGNGVPEVIFK